jgi:hypothetical protein
MVPPSDIHVQRIRFGCESNSSYEKNKSPEKPGIISVFLLSFRFNIKINSMIDYKLVFNKEKTWVYLITRVGTF